MGWLLCWRRAQGSLQRGKKPPERAQLTLATVPVQVVALLDAESEEPSLSRAALIPLTEASQPVARAHTHTLQHRNSTTVALLSQGTLWFSVKCPPAGGALFGSLWNLGGWDLTGGSGSLR